MSNRDARAYLWDVEQAARAISTFLAGMDFETYARNELVQAAVERKFEIIGEALTQLNKLDSALAHRIPNIRDAIAFRNILIHGYVIVDHHRVWRIALESLPGLRAVVAALLAELSSGG